MEKDLTESFAKGKVQVFVGSGLSYGVYPTGEKFRDELLTEDFYVDGRKTSIGKLMKTKNVSLEDAAEFYEVYAKPDALMTKIQRVFDTQPGPTRLHQHLWELPYIRWIYTTNFDCLIEDAVRPPHQPALVVTTGSSHRELPSDRRIVFKPHGCARTSRTRSEFVISRNDYLNYSYRRPLETLKTLYDLSTRVFLFLGYSLRDLNMRHIITEANRLGSVRSYAVIRHAPGPEARYWQKLGVTLMDLDVEEFFQMVFREFPPDTSEFRIKVDLRVEDKEAIANKALKRISREIKTSGSINLILDAGTTTLFVARAIAAALESGTLRGDVIRFLTNSSANVEALLGVMQLRGKKAEICVIGGPLKYETRAFTPAEETAAEQLRAAKANGRRTVALIGVTSLDKDGLKTRTAAEVPVKRAIIDTADHVYVLADHSKTKELTEWHLFAEWRKDKMSIITDRVDYMAGLKDFVTKIW
jgi:DeoR/GlpR family transcriptional regulator of sugar metabolism